ncbi:MAG: alpha/beta hydrolase [Thermodesulfobacteriota bacterium]|nr:alpha/beta hydrolase [Thermodesulfobacteriota bacterium]
MNPKIRTITFILGVCLTVITMSGCAAFQDSLFKMGLGVERFRSGLDAKSLQLDNYTIAYTERKGEPGGDTIILLHGFTADKSNWVRFVRYIPAQYRILVLDMPGHGDSTQDMDKSYTVTDMVGCVAEAIDRIGLKQFHLAGNSLGGLVATRYTLRYQNRVLTLGLFNAAGVKAPTPSDLEKHVKQGDNFLIPNSRKAFDRLMGFTFVDQPFIPWPGRAVLARMYMKNYELNQKMWGEINNENGSLQDVSGQLGNIALPVLILWGDTDRLLHVSSVSVFEQHLPDSTTVIMKNCGHIPMMERPKEAAVHYVRFLNNHASQTR